MTPETQTATLIYVGPEGQESPLLGPLVAGRRYQVAADLAGYLAAIHPNYWQLPGADVEHVEPPSKE